MISNEVPVPIRIPAMRIPGAAVLLSGRKSVRLVSCRSEAKSAFRRRSPDRRRGEEQLEYPKTLDTSWTAQDSSSLTPTKQPVSSFARPQPQPWVQTFSPVRATGLSCSISK